MHPGRHIPFLLTVLSLGLILFTLSYRAYGYSSEI
jgi:hypothetical protein